MTHRSIVACCLAVIGVVALAAWAGHGPEQRLTLGQVPEAARLALEAQAGGAEIVAVERELRHGAAVFEAEWVVDGNEHEAAVTAEGALLETSTVISVDDAPAAVRATIATWFGADATLEVERKTIVAYEVEAAGGKELLILPTGGVHQGADDDDHDDDEDDDD